ncbi:hypothetical protein CAPTEDRAFT_213794 [Capitella teleta]|uniref:Uncharacterized protein n=1 Tax=Capitella teleta TaxID=283909 RepID=R7U7X2_CAPTE|nr:hypothetical protein CAPTEDRAFT_213794 [Capitella teleta]|eukprot:ELU02256.1 hypothetical protein CAPTEDRAFT_213794 [Capitella teleta]
MQFSTTLKNEAVKRMKILTENDIQRELWAELNQIALAYITLFNRRRAGEMSKILQTSFTSRMPLGVQKMVKGCLSPVERELCSAFSRMQITVKKGRTVTVLLISEMEAWIAILNENRCHTQNCNAEQPEVQNCKDQLNYENTSLKWHKLLDLLRFTGHNIQVHRKYYRLTEDALQVAKVSKLLLASEGGFNITGMKLDDIEVAQANERRVWTEDEKGAILNHFRKEIVSQCLPMKRDIERCLANEPAH